MPLLDVSGSVDATDWRLPMEGTTDGMADPAVTRVIERHASARGGRW